MNVSTRITPVLLALSALALTACTNNPTQESAATPAQTPEPAFEVKYEKFVLDNGLEVVFHQDDSDPVTAVALTFHVGSARELEGRTGFAHLFEHFFI